MSHRRVAATCSATRPAPPRRPTEPPCSRWNVDDQDVDDGAAAPTSVTEANPSQPDRRETGDDDDRTDALPVRSLAPPGRRSPSTEEVFGGELVLNTLADFGREDGPGDAVAHGMLEGPVGLFAADAGPGEPSLQLDGVLVLCVLGTAESGHARSPGSAP